ncbi:hypothetical protein [Actinoplanes sp. HUAS TT8]|uniref:hypothetical protein n=1 Tax=Actinoplanes sp. HUAS TT8 TaxID=3447453 RepID=UPI003F51F11E
MDTAGRCRLLGFGLGAGIGFVLTRTYLFDLAPVVLALCLAIGVLAGEAVSRRPPGEFMTATLRTRRIRDYLPVAPVVVSLALELTLAAVTWWFRTPARPDHEIEYFGTAAPVTLVTSWVTLAAAAVLTLVTVWLVVRSGAVANETGRHAIVNRLAHAYAALTATIFTSTTFWYADSQLDWRGGGVPAWGVALGALAGLGLATLAYYAGQLLRPQHSTGNDRALVVAHP